MARHTCHFGSIRRLPSGRRQAGTPPLPGLLAEPIARQAGQAAFAGSAADQRGCRRHQTGAAGCRVIRGVTGMGRSGVSRR